MVGNMESILRIHHFTHLQPKQFMEIFRQLIFLDSHINNQQGGNAWQSTLHYWLQNDKGKRYQYLEPIGTLGTKTRRARRTSFKRLGHRNARDKRNRVINVVILFGVVF